MKTKNNKRSENKGKDAAAVIARFKDENSSDKGTDTDKASGEEKTNGAADAAAMTDGW